MPYMRNVGRLPVRLHLERADPKAETRVWCIRNRNDEFRYLAAVWLPYKWADDWSVSDDATRAVGVKVEQHNGQQTTVAENGWVWVTSRDERLGKHRAEVRVFRTEAGAKRAAKRYRKMRLKRIEQIKRAEQGKDWRQC